MGPQWGNTGRTRARPGVSGANTKSHIPMLNVKGLGWSCLKYKLHFTYAVFLSSPQLWCLQLLGVSSAVQASFHRGKGLDFQHKNVVRFWRSLFNVYSNNELLGKKLTFPQEQEKGISPYWKFCWLEICSRVVLSTLGWHALGSNVSKALQPEAGFVSSNPV